MVPPELTHRIIGSAMEVHNFLGPGFIESIYQHALLHELALQGLPAETERRIDILYKDELVGKHRLDVIVSGLVVLN